MTKKEALEAAEHDIEMLLDAKKIKEASAKYGDWQLEAYDRATEVAIKAVKKEGRLTEQVRLLNGVIEEQEAEVKRLEKAEDAIRRLRKSISQYLVEVEGVDSPIVKAQTEVLECCLEVIG